MVTRYEADHKGESADGYESVVIKPDGDFVTYQDYAALETRLLALLEHPAMKAHAEALREAQTTGLAFIRVNANGHVQVLPSDRVQLSVIQAVEERTAAAAHPKCEHDWGRTFTGQRMCCKCGAIK